MKKADQLLESLGETYGYLQAYIEQRIDLAKLEAAEKSSQVLASFITLVVVVFLLLILLAMLTVTAALFIGRALDENYALGFLIMSGVYFLMAAVIYTFRRPLVTNRVLGMVIAKLFPDPDDSNS